MTRLNNKYTGNFDELVFDLYNYILGFGNWINIQNLFLYFKVL